MGLGRLAHDRQPESRAGQPARVLGPVEAIEEVRKVLRVESRTRIAHREDAVAEGDVALAARGAPFDRVVEQVRDRPADLLR